MEGLGSSFVSDPTRVPSLTCGEIGGNSNVRFIPLALPWLTLLFGADPLVNGRNA